MIRLVGLIIFDHDMFHQQARLTALFPVSAGREREAREASKAKQINFCLRYFAGLPMGTLSNNHKIIKRIIITTPNLTALLMMV